MVETTTGAPPNGEQRGAVKEQAQEATEQAKQQAQQQAQQVAGQARDRVREQVDQRSTDAGERLSTQAHDVRSVGEELRKQGKEGPAKIADQAAERVERAGSWLRDSDADRILGDAEDFARRNPWAVVAGGVAIGFVASRFLKASSSERYRQSYGQGDGQRRQVQDRFLPASGGTTP